MPSGMTHILLVKYLQNQHLEDDLRNTLADGRDFLQIGAVGPDLPYASIADGDFLLTTQSELADKFHYERSNGVPLYAMKMLRERMGQLSPQEIRHTFCFFLGYISHIVADGTIHPYVRDMVGDYRGHQSEHRILEMNLDVLLYYHLTLNSASPIELNYSHMHDELKNLEDSTELRKIGDLFSESIQYVYDGKYETEQILGWITGLHRMFNVAAGKHPRIYRNIGFIENFLFKDYDDLTAQYGHLLNLTKPIDRAVNFLSKPKIDYFEEAIPHFYEKFIPIAKKAYAYIFENGPALSEADIYPIDLDTGRPLAANGDLNVTPTFWS